MVSSVPNIHLGMYKNYQNFHPLIFYGYTRLHEVGADLPPPLAEKGLIDFEKYGPEIWPHPRFKVNILRVHARAGWNEHTCVLHTIMT